LSDLVDRRCKPCEGGVDPLSGDKAVRLMAELHSDWALFQDGKSIAREFLFATFGRTIAFANAVAWVATTEGHHPEMTVNYGSCRVRYTTNAIDGLSDNDFICAAKIDRFFEDV